MRIVIVTGANGNLGKAVVSRFRTAGYRVIGTVTPQAQPAPEDENYEEVAVDLTNEDDSRQLVDSVIGKHGKIDTAVLTVGGFAKGTLAETPTSAIVKQYGLNFETTYNVARPCFMQMMTQGSGRIFIVGSKAGLQARDGKGVVAYSLSKSLLFRLAELMNDEAKGSNVVTSVIVPSTIDTPQNRQSMPDATFENWVTAEQIAEIVYQNSADMSSPVREPIIKIYNNA